MNETQFVGFSFFKVSFSLFTKEVFKNVFTETPVDFHEVRQAVEILLTRDPVRFLCLFCLLARVVEPEEGALMKGQKQGHINPTLVTLLSRLSSKPKNSNECLPL